jgi:hypothetical protein
VNLTPLRFDTEPKCDRWSQRLSDRSADRIEVDVRRTRQQTDSIHEFDCFESILKKAARFSVILIGPHRHSLTKQPNLPRDIRKPFADLDTFDQPEVERV